MKQMKKQRIAAWLLLIGPAIFLITEFITATAWSDPAYSYTYDFISNLGVRGPSKLFGQEMNSPLSWLMNTGFITFGVVTFAGIFLLNFKKRGHKLLSIVLGATLMLGSTLVGVFHGSGEALIDGTGMYHSIGAFMAFIAGNALLIFISRPKTGVINITKQHLYMGLGVFGLIGIVIYTTAIMFAATDHQIIIIGLIERCAIYPFLVGLILVGRDLLLSMSKIKK